MLPFVGPCPAPWVLADSDDTVDTVCATWHIHSLWE